MKEQTIYTFSDDDLKLLKQPIPINPCSHCLDSGSCCGCPEERKYQTIIKPYRDNNLLVLPIQFAIYERSVANPTAY